LKLNTEHVPTSHWYGSKVHSFGRDV